MNMYLNTEQAFKFGFSKEEIQAAQRFRDGHIKENFYLAKRMREMPVVSVVIPCYNQSQYLPECVASVLRSSYGFSNIQTIIVDDYSGVYVDFQDLDMGFPPVEIYRHTENRGLSAARNTGIIHARGRYILLLDADDTIEPTYIEKAVAEMEKGADIVSCWMQQFEGNQDRWEFGGDLSLSAFLQQNRIHCCSMFRREIFEKIGGYDEDMKLGWEDYMVNVLAVAAGYKVSVIPEYLFNYRIHEDSMTRASTNKHHDEIKAYMRSKHPKLKFTF